MTQNDRDLRVRADRRPLAHQVADALLAYVSEQSLGSGDSLPSEPDLAQLFGVGRSTIREALMHLESDGIINRRQGFGTVLTALASGVNVGLEVLEPIEARARRFGWSVSAADVAIETVAADEALAEHLMVDIGADITVITRTLVSDPAPLAVIRSYLTDRIPDAAGALRAGVLADELFNPTNAAYAMATVLPAVAEGDIARRLTVDEGTLVLRIEQLIVGADDLPRDWSEQWIASDRLRVDVLRRPPRARNASPHSSPGRTTTTT